MELEEKTVAIMGFSPQSHDVTVHVLVFSKGDKSWREHELSIAEFPFEKIPVRKYSDMDERFRAKFDSKITTFTFNVKKSRRNQMKINFISMSERILASPRLVFANNIYIMFCLCFDYILAPL